jgi:flavin-dependent dehydrogenase
MAGWPPPARRAPALECELHLEAPDFQRLSLAARFDFGFPPRGYGWVFPKRTHLSVGVVNMRPGSVNLNTALDDYLRYLGIRTFLSRDLHGWTIPVKPRPGPMAPGRILLTGDAAGLADPVTAEGITHTILSGQLVAQAIKESFLDASRTAVRYQSLLEENILGELRAGRKLAALLYGFPRFRNWVFTRGGHNLAEFMADVVMGSTSYREALRRPSAYLKAFGFRRLFRSSV